MIRVFPSKNRATPRDTLCFFGPPPLDQCRPPIMPVRVSCTFTWDRPRAERLANEWSAFYPDVQVGGPAYGDPGGDFVPGRFLKKGCVITSRGCPNRCDFCFVPCREGGIRSLPITEGWDVLDNNLLACCDSHIEAVFQMLRYQNRCVRFSGGFEAARVTKRVVDLLQTVRLPQSKAALWLAYDRPQTAGTVRGAIARLLRAGMNRRQVGCYVLIGRDGDTLDAAEGRCKEVLAWGALPFAMLYRDEQDTPHSRGWDRLQRRYCRPAMMLSDQERRLSLVQRPLEMG